MGEYWRNFDFDILTKSLTFAGDLRRIRLPIDPALHRCSDISASSFLQEFLLRNKLVIIGSSLTKQWKSREWRDANTSLPNFKLLSANFGPATVPVANCGEQLFGAHVKESMVFDEFLRYWQDAISRRDKPQEGTRCLYLKDWHFCKQFPGYGAYDIAPHFSSDWLNEFWDGLGDGDDYRFVYMGPKSSWTPFHADVFRSYSWSSNICGRKRWLIYPPGEEDFLRDCHGNLPFDITSTDLQDPSCYPQAAQAKAPLEVIQETGETIFIPSGWHHQVENLEDTISINHNWGNACNIDIMWKKLQADLNEVENEISDCHDMDGFHEQCQLILKAHSGMNYHQMLHFLAVIGQRRCASLAALLALSTKASSAEQTEPRQDACLSTVQSDPHDFYEVVQESCTAWFQQACCPLSVNDDISLLSQVAGLAFELLCLLPVLDALLSSSSFMAVCSAEEEKSGTLLKRAAAHLCRITVAQLQGFAKEKINLSVDLSAFL